MSNDNLRIAMLSVHSCPLGRLGERDTGGMSVYIRELATELGKQGHRVDIYTRVHDFSDPQVIELDPNVRLIHLRAGRVMKMHKLMLYPHLSEFASNVEKFRQHHDLSYDLIHSHYWLSGWVGQKLQERWDVPHLTMFHTLGHIKNTVGIGEGEPGLRLETEATLISNCDRIIAATQREKDDLIARFGVLPDGVGVVPCGVNRERFKPLGQRAAREELNLNGQKVILFVGRIDPLKGIENLLQAARLTPLENFKLMIVGGHDRDKSDIRKLQKLAQSLSIGDAVSFMGSVPQEDLPTFYSAADVCVMPSYYESFGLVALESLACGTPVVASRVGGVESFLRHGQTGYITDNNSPQNLAPLLNAVLNDNNELLSAEEIGDSVSGFGWSGVARAVSRQYRKAIQHYPMPVSI